jgi:hypothetical protein
MDVERRHFRQSVIVEDLVEGSLVIAAEKNIVMRDLRIFLIHTPIEHDGGAGVEFFVELLCFGAVGQQLIVDVRQVCIADKNIGSEGCGHLQFTPTTLVSFTCIFFTGAL